MAYTYKQFEDAMKSAGLEKNFDAYDLKLAAANPDAGMQLLSAKQNYKAAATDDQRALAHAEAEDVRSANPDYYSADALSGKDVNTQRKEIGDLRNEIYGDLAGGFSYDRENDPKYQAAKKEYTREAERSMRDTLGKASAMTGGALNTYATMAGQQAQDYTMSQFTDRTGEFYDDAYQRYRDQNSAKLSLLESMKDSEQQDYERTLYEMERQEAEKGQQKEAAQKEVAGMLAAGTCPSRELIAASGYSEEYVQAICRAKGIPYLGTAWSGGGSGAGGGGRLTPEGPANSPENVAAAKRLAGGPTKGDKSGKVGAAKDVSYLTSGNSPYTTFAKYEARWDELNHAANSGASKEALAAKIRNWELEGKISATASAEMKYSFGIEDSEG